MSTAPSRLEQLLRMVEEDPEDVFGHYALGLEYVGTDPSRSVEIFRYLVRKWPGYVPVYYQLGSLLYDMGRVEEALSVLHRGIQAAQDAKDTKALAELKNLYANVSLEL